MVEFERKGNVQLSYSIYLTFAIIVWWLVSLFVFVSKNKIKKKNKYKRVRRHRFVRIQYKQTTDNIQKANISNQVHKPWNIRGNSFVYRDKQYRSN